MLRKLVQIARSINIDQRTKIRLARFEESFASKLKKVRVVIVIALVLILVSQIGISALSQGTPKLEGDLGVANVTKGDTVYSKSVNVRTDDVVKFSMDFHNPNPPGSGIVNHNVTIRFVLPTQTATTLTTSAIVQGSNTNSITGQASTVSTERVSLQYIPGSAVWRHNIGDDQNPNFQDQTISDAVTTTGVNLGDQLPCQNQRATVTILARVMQVSFSIHKYVANGTTNEQNWTKSNTGTQGDLLKYKIAFTNTGNTPLNNVVIRDQLPSFLTYVPGSTKLWNPSNNGTVIADGLTTTAGVNVGTMPVANTTTWYITFRATINSNTPGGTTLENKAFISAQGTGSMYDTAVTVVPSAPPPPPPPPPPPVTPPAVISAAVGPQVKGLAVTGPEIYVILGMFVIAASTYLYIRQRVLLEVALMSV